MIINDSFVPLLANPALSAVIPESSLFNFIVPKDARKDDVIHITGHRILNKKLVSHLVDSHEHESQFSS